MENMIIMSDGEQITLDDLPIELKSSISARYDLHAGEVSSLKDMMGNFEAQIIRNALNLNGDILSAAKFLEVHHTTLWRKMNRYGITLSQIDRQ